MNTKHLLEIWEVFLLSSGVLTLYVDPNSLILSHEDGVLFPLAEF